MAPLTTGVIQAILREFSQQRAGRGRYVSGGGSGITATGGVISDYSDGPAVYRAHVFTSTGTFSVSALGTFGSNVEYLVVAGGGGGGIYYGGGGGAGGYRTNVPGATSGGGGGAEAAFPVSTSPGVYSVSVGAGGAGGPSSVGAGSQGAQSSFGPTIISTGGGYGGAGVSSPPGGPGGPGGSGGGGGYGPSNGSFPGGPGTPGQGFAGGNSYHVAAAMGGGGREVGPKGDEAGGDGEDGHCGGRRAHGC